MPCRIPMVTSRSSAAGRATSFPPRRNYTIQVPVAKNRDGSSITGPLMLRFTNLTGHTTPLVIPRGQPSPYPPVSLDTTKATLISATGETATGAKTGRREDCRHGLGVCGLLATTPFPGTPDPGRICVKNGFDPALLYELQYTVKDPLVLGIGLAATQGSRCVLSIRKSRCRRHAESGRRIDHARDLRGKLAVGDVSEIVAAARLQPGRARPHRVGRHEPAHRRAIHRSQPPLRVSRRPGLAVRAWPRRARLVDALGRHGAPAQPAASLLDRCRATNTCPKIAETFGSAEIWGLRQSFTLVGTTAKKDIPLADNVRRYYFPGVSHGGGPGGFATFTNPVKAAASCALPSNPAPSGPMRAALISRLVAWVTNEHADAREQVSDARRRHARAEHERRDGLSGHSGPADARRAFSIRWSTTTSVRTSAYADQSGVLTKTPVAKGTLPQLVVRVDADGNEVAGIKSPLLSAPLGTYTGWNVTTSGLYKGQLCGSSFGASPIGGFIPFAKTKAERTASGDPRLSLEERYVDHDGYVRAVKTAADTLVREGYLLAEDAATMIGQAEQSQVLR